MRVAVVAHEGKQLDGGLGALRHALADEGFDDPLWFLVDKSRKAPRAVEKALKKGADLVLVWGGDGMVQRSVDVMAGKDATLGILPAGTANLLANNLGIPIDLEGSLQLALHGTRRHLDVGTVNGEHFAVMAGAGFDARMVVDADKGAKERLGRVAYVKSGAKAMSGDRMKMRIDVDGSTWFEGKASCVLVGNVSSAFGGLELFPEAKPDDGLLEVGIVTAKGPVGWARVLARASLSHPNRSPLVDMTAGKRIDVRMEEEQVYEVDGGDRPAAKRLKVRIESGALVVAAPVEVPA
jgi:diacylglycerol kinase (ATP)